MNLTRRGAIVIFAILFISLALNFAAAGYFGSQYFWSRNGPTPAERLASVGIARLPAELRQEFVQQLAKDRVPLRGPFRDIRDARSALVDAMRQQPLDEAAVQLAFDNLHKSLEAAATIAEAAIIRGLSASTAETRAAIEPLPPVPAPRKTSPGPTPPSN